MPVPSARDRLTTAMNDAVERAMQDAEDEITSSLLTARGAVRAAFRQYQLNADINTGMSTEHHASCLAIPGAHPLGVECCAPQCPRRKLVTEILRLGGGDAIAYSTRTREESR